MISVISSSGKRYDNYLSYLFNLVKDEKLILISNKIPKDPKDPAFGIFMNYPTDPKIFTIKTILDEINSGILEGDIFSFDPKTNYYICNRDSNIKIFKNNICKN